MNALSLIILGAQKYFMYRGSDIPTFVDRPYHQHTQRYFYYYGYRTRHKKSLGGAVSFFVRKLRKMRICEEIITHIVLIFQSGKWQIGKI